MSTQPARDVQDHVPAQARGDYRSPQELLTNIEDRLIRGKVVQYARSGWTLTNAGPDWATMQREKGAEFRLGLLDALVEHLTRHRIVRIKIDKRGVTTL